MKTIFPIPPTPSPLQMALITWCGAYRDYDGDRCMTGSRERYKKFREISASLFETLRENGYSRAPAPIGEEDTARIIAKIYRPICKIFGVEANKGPESAGLSDNSPKLLAVLVCLSILRNMYSARPRAIEKGFQWKKGQATVYLEHLDGLVKGSANSQLAAALIERMQNGLNLICVRMKITPFQLGNQHWASDIIEW